MIIGIDPGDSGAIAVLWTAGGVEVWDFKGLTELDIFQRFQVLKRRADNAGGQPSAVLERDQYFPGQGGSSSFKYGAQYGGIRMALLAAGISFTTVMPAKWKRAIGLARRKNETNTDYKNRSKAKAQELFPGIKITHANAEAILLAWYGVQHG